MTSNITLFASYYQSPDNDRQHEIDLCLRNNVDLEEINHIYLFIDDEAVPPIESNKVTIIQLPHRPTYADWIETILNASIKGICLLANSDIYFDETISRTRELLDHPNRFMALSRWDMTETGMKIHPNPKWSQDVWGVNSASEFDSGLINALKFHLGLPRCDNKVAYLFSIYGWKVYNPVHFIHSYHVHQSEYRGYEKKGEHTLIGGVGYPHPGKELLDEAVVDIDVWVLRANRNRLSAINSSLEQWQIETRKSAGTYLDLSGPIGQPIQSQEMTSAINDGECIFSHDGIYEIYRRDDHLYLRNQINNTAYKRQVSYTKSDAQHRISLFFPAMLTDHVSKINDSATNIEDVNFWQYPCSTEKQAWLNHETIHDFNTFRANSIDMYVPLPWATWIDKKRVPEDIIAQVKEKLSWYTSLAKAYQIVLRTHTVCQQIHWRRIVSVAEEIGITDLHLSHKDSSSETIEEMQTSSLRLHGWPLVAVNYVIGSRSEGLRKLRFKDKKILASFIGAYMPHYINEDRLKIVAAGRKANRDDVIIDLVNEWHFNKTVYKEQVTHKALTEDESEAQRVRTLTYNSILTRSKFSLCPIGSGPNTLRLWESIAIGTIPVLFSDDLAIFHESDEGKQLLENCILWQDEINESLFEHLAALPAEDMSIMQDNLMVLYEHFSQLRCFAL